MKNKGLIIATISFFLLVNTTYYWEGKLGFFAMPILLLFVIAYLVLVIALVGQVYFAIKEKFTGKLRLFIIGLLIVVLGLTFYKPGGIIDFDKLEGGDLLVAQREGSANCMTTLKLKEDFTFREKSVCFGVREIKGKFHLQNDTIYFDHANPGRHGTEFYKFAIVTPSKYNKDGKHFDLKRFKSLTDTIGHELWITKNELNKVKDKEVRKR